MSTLKMVKEWDYDNFQLYVAECDRFTSARLGKYWASIDAAIRFWMVAVQPKIHNKWKKNSSLKSTKTNDYHRYHWDKNKNRQQKYFNQSHRRDPTPP